MRKSLSVPGKITITIHVVYVEPDSIAGMLALAHLCPHLSYLLLRHITPATEVVSNSPARRKWHAPGKFCILLHHIRGCGAGEKVGDQAISLHSHAYFCLVGFADVHLDPSSMVNEYSIDSAIVDGKAKIERYGGVHSDRVFVMSLVWIDIPDGKSLAAFIHTASALTQAIDTLLAGKRTRQPHSSGCDSEPLQVRFQDGT